ncbi:MAG: DUF4252 domain-containing protein [Verrucomicrobia bacterium]|nr:DUF4252 domain-containing protein [Verrucomicrobiota bacterium]
MKSRTEQKNKYLRYGIFEGRRLSALVIVTICGLFIQQGSAQQASTTLPLDKDPAYLKLDSFFDFTVVEPTVNVNIPKFLLKNIVSELNGGEGDPFAELGLDINVADLTKDLRLVRVLVLESRNEDIRKAVARGVDGLRKSMNSRWIPIVNVPDGNVTIYAMGDESGERMVGLGLIIAEGENAVIGNIVGEIPIGKIISIATRIASQGQGGDKAKLFLQKLMGGMQSPPPAEDVSHENEDEDKN